MNEKLQPILLHISKLKKIGSVKFHSDYHLLIQHTSFLPTNASVSQRVWHIKNNVFELPSCSECSNSVSWRKDKGGFYSKTCSKKCDMSSGLTLQKIKETNQQKYGSDTPFGNKTVQEKTKVTVQQRYGVENVSQLNQVKVKKQQTTYENYGVLHHLQSEKIRENIQATNIQRYGVKNVRSSDIVKNKIKKTMERLYKRTYSNQQHIPDYVLSQLKDKQWLIDQHYTQKKPLITIAQELNINDTTVGKYLHSHGLVARRYFCSVGELEILNWCKSFGYTVISNDRETIPPYEIDILLPHCNIAIEYCGLYWHSEQMGKDQYYHKRKLDMCKQQGIRLITIFEDEWIRTPDIVKRKITHIINKEHTNVFARKTKVVEISKQQRQLFLTNNHIQGDGGGSFYCGLEYNNNIIAVISFIEKTPGCFVIARYASSVRVVGGFSKLLSYFQKESSWNTITTFADLRWDTGDVYTKTGFSDVKILPPDYYYSPDGKKRVHKFNYRRKNLPKLLTTFDSALSETVNCDNNNILRIWDCGKIRFTLTK